MKKIGKIILTLVCGTLLLFFVVEVDHIIGRGPERNYYLLAAYLGLGVLSVVATGAYLKRKNVDLNDSGSIWLATLATSGGALILAWPLLLPVVIWSETFLPKILKKHYFPTKAPEDESVPLTDRPRSDEEKVEAMRNLLRRSSR